MMNAKAKELGLKHTHAVDPHGLSKQRDARRRPTSRCIARQRAWPIRCCARSCGRTSVSRSARQRQARSVTVRPTQLLGSYRGIEGVKTGFTNPAGYCFVGAAKRGGIELSASCSARMRPRIASRRCASCSTGASRTTEAERAGLARRNHGRRRDRQRVGARR